MDAPWTPAPTERGWFDRPLNSDDLAVPEGEREAWADVIGAVTLARMRLSWPPQTITHWMHSGSLLVVQGLVPAWTLQPLAPPVLQPHQDGPWMPHLLVAECSRQVMASTVRDAESVADMLPLEQRIRVVLDWWHAPSRILGGIPPREGLELAVMPQLLLYAAYAAGGRTKWLPESLRDLGD
jgi:hypothetical protein